MNLSLPSHFSWNLSPTDFKKNIQSGKKIHHFTEKIDASPADKLLFFEESIPFNLDYNNRKFPTWYIDETEWTEENHDGDTEQEKFFPEHRQAVPVITCVDNWRIIVTHDPNSSIYLLINGILTGIAEMHPIQDKFHGAFVEIAENEGLEPIVFARRLLNMEREGCTTGRIIHWTRVDYTDVKPIL